MPRANETSGWTGAGQGGRFGTVERQPIQPQIAAIASGAAPAGGVTRPPPNPITGKPYRPGERLERQARQFAKKQAPSAHAAATPSRRTRDYETMIARALEEMGVDSD